MTIRRARSAAAHAELRSLLQQPAGRARGSSRARTLTFEEVLLAQLRKRAAEGDTQAFEVLKDFERRFPPLAAALQCPSSTDVWSFFVCRGGVLTVPAGVDVEEVAAMLRRGMTEEEKARLLEKARGSFEARLHPRTPDTA